MDQDSNELDPEIAAISAVNTALKTLEPEAQARVLQYVARKLKLVFDLNREDRVDRTRYREEVRDDPPPPEVQVHDGKEDVGGLGGISSTAKKWIVRNGLSVAQLSR